MPYVQSSAIEYVHYEPVTAELTVTFNNGRRYVYFGVPRRIGEALVAAPSVGGYFNTNVRDRFRFRRLR